MSDSYSKDPAKAKQKKDDYADLIAVGLIALVALLNQEGSAGSIQKTTNSFFYSLIFILIVSVFIIAGVSIFISKKFKSSRSYEGGLNALDGEIYLIRKYFWNLSSDDLKILQTDQAVRDLKTKADAYRQMIDLKNRKAQTLLNQINLINEQINNSNLSEKEKTELLEEKNYLLQKTSEEEDKYRQLLEQVDKQKNGLLNDINKMESGVKL